MRRPLLALVLPLALACGDTAAPAPPLVPFRTADLAPGTRATLWADGRFELARDGAPILRTKAGLPLFSRALDGDRPDAWHDPTRVAEVPFEIANDSLVDMGVPEPGVLRLALREDGAPVVLVRLALALGDELVTGLGERFGHVDARGTVAPMHLALDLGSESGTNEAHVPVPFLVSTKGWGVFVRTHEAGAFDVGALDGESWRATFEGRSLEVFVFADRDPLDVIARFARHTGLPRPLPRWALGPMLWHNEWKSAEEVLAVASELRARRIYNTSVLDPARFADAAGMMQTLASRGFRTIAWSTPYLEKPLAGAPANEAQSLWLQADAAKHLLRDASGRTFAAPGFDVDRQLGMLDFTSAGASAFWSGLAGRAVASGFRGFKLDYGEDLIPQLLGARLGIRRSDGSTERTARTYPLGYHRAYRDALAAAGGGVLVVRASSFGGARQADVIWPGDLDSDFERFGDLDDKGRALVGGLPSAVIAAQTLSTSGFPSFGSDTGGFRHGKPEREALLRWAEHTTFSVILQLGGGGDSHDPWTYDEEASGIYASLARTHQRLVPYLSQLLRGAESVGAPTIRTVALAYPDDVAARAHADDEYLLGPDLLVAPVLARGATSRTVHVPRGTWVGFWDRRRVDGPRDVEVEAPLGKPPVFLRAGALLPLLPDGIDTLVDATDGTTIPVTARAGEWEALSVPRGRSVATYDDGSALEVSDDAREIRLRFAPAAPGSSVVVELDLGAVPTSAAAIYGQPVTVVATEDDVRASTTSAAWLGPLGRTLVKIVGAADVALR